MTNWAPYEKAEGNTCEYYYKKAREIYGSDNEDISIYDNTVTIFDVEAVKELDFGSDYMECIDRLCQLKDSYLNSGSFNGFSQFRVPHESQHRHHAIECELDKLLHLVVPMIEKDFLQSNAAISYEMMYRNIVRDEPEPDNDTTWQWHFDSYPEEANKIMIYLTDVTEDDAPFTYLVDSDDNPMLLKSNAKYIDPKKELRLDYKELNGFNGSRVPISWINEKKSQGCKEKTWTGKKGSFAFFRPNVIHKATVAKRNHRDVMSFTIRPSLTKRESYWFDSPSMHGHHHHDWYGAETINKKDW